jgi:hypothetical protein
MTTGSLFTSSEDFLMGINPPDPSIWILLCITCHVARVDVVGPIEPDVTPSQVAMVPSNKVLTANR